MMENNPTPSPELVPEAAPSPFPSRRKHCHSPARAAGHPPAREAKRAAAAQGVPEPLPPRHRQYRHQPPEQHLQARRQDPGARRCTECGVACGQHSHAHRTLEAERSRAALPQRRVPQPFSAGSVSLCRACRSFQLAGADRRIQFHRPARLFWYSAGLLLVLSALSAYHQLTACAEAFDGADDEMAAKWRKLCTWQVVVIGCFGAFLIPASCFWVCRRLPSSTSTTAA